jgi:site-specific DNA-methyltransferase (adenine-specific)
MELHLLQGDCLDVLPTLPDKSVDAIITDLPYGTTACKWDVVIPFAPMWEQVKRVCKSVLVCSNLEWFRYEFSWDKKLPNGFLDAKRKPMRRHENIAVFYNGSHVYNPQMSKGVPYKIKRHHVTSIHAEYHPVDTNNESGERYPTSILEFPNIRNKDGHPTQKPVALYEYLIRTYTNEGDTVLDFCMGSGTTGVACVKTNRNFIGIEKEHDYFEIAERRITDAQLQLSMDFANA